MDVQHLHGGTGDVNPQLMHFSAAQSGADTTTTTELKLHIPKHFGSMRPTVIEILKVFLYWGAQAEVDSAVNVFFSTTSFGTTATTASEPRVFAAGRLDIKITTSGQTLRTDPLTLDLTDGAGHGVLIGTDSIFIQVESASTSLTNTVKGKILYRYKSVGMQEYIGMVQSQNS
jgi:hypothetical protein